MIPKNLLIKEKKKSILKKGKTGNAKRPRLSVFRSNRFIYAQLIDDSSGKTLISVSGRDIKETKDKLKPVEIAGLIGEELAYRAVKKNIKNAIFDRRGYRYHGRVASVAEGARKAGLII